MAEVFVKFEAVQPKVSLKEALERISHEFGIDSNGCNLTIIDRYFLKLAMKMSFNRRDVNIVAFRRWG